jgi:hypothetical protein
LFSWRFVFTFAVTFYSIKLVQQERLFKRRIA